MQASTPGAAAVDAKVQSPDWTPRGRGACRHQSWGSSSKTLSEGFHHLCQSAELRCGSQVGLAGACTHCTEMAVIPVAPRRASVEDLLLMRRMGWQRHRALHPPWQGRLSAGLLSKGSSAANAPLIELSQYHSLVTAALLLQSQLMPEPHARDQPQLFDKCPHLLPA